MKAFKQAFLEQLNHKQHKDNLIKSMLICAHELKQKEANLNLTNVRINDIVELGIKHKMPTALLFGGLFNLMGLFGFSVNYKKSYQLLMELVRHPSSGEYGDFAHLGLSFMHLFGLGVEQCKKTALNHLEQIQDKSQILFNILSQAAAK